MSTQGFLSDDQDARGSRYQVGASDPDSNYEGPVALIAYDESWLHIETDPCEGHVMLNIEALPFLRQALAKIAQEIGSAARHP